VNPSGDLPLDNETLVRWEFASEERLEQRNAIFRSFTEGDDAEEMVFEAVREISPARVLEIGPGAGALAGRIKNELGAEVSAIDVSERMVKLTRERGVDAEVGDVQQLPYEDGTFDCVVAGWVLYHVPNRDRAVGECARVLRPGGRLVAATVADDSMAELWEFVGSPRKRELSFSSGNGAAQLQRHFARVDAREAYAVVVFPSPKEMRAFISANITRAHLIRAVPEFTEPVPVPTHDTVFVADKT
jgi:ubiquinone/menaquinone biosynthesis C-methylase UbiE